MGRNGRRPSIAVVASQFNGPITQALVDGALEALQGAGVARSRIRVFRVPGAFELPVAAATVAAVLRPQAIVALGCLIKGQTPQYAAIGHAVAQGLAQVSVNERVPVGFGVIVADSIAQAKARAGGPVGHRGREAALAALEMVEFAATLPRRRR